MTFVEAQSLELQMADTAILALRLNEGLELGAFEGRFGRPAEDVFRKTFVQAHSGRAGGARERQHTAD